MRALIKMIDNEKLKEMIAHLRSLRGPKGDDANSRLGAYLGNGLPNKFKEDLRAGEIASLLEELLERRNEAIS